MILILTYIGCYFQLQWFITSGLSSKELALGTTAIVFELFISHLILGKFCFKLQLKSWLFSPIAQVLFPSLPLGRMFQHILLIGSLTLPVLHISNSDTIAAVAPYGTYCSDQSYAKISNPIHRPVYSLIYY